MQLPLAYLNSAVIEEVSPELWREVFDAVGWPEALAGKHDSFSHEDVLTVLQEDPSDELLQAIETLHELGTENGRDAIVAAMNDRQVPMDELPGGTSERELALHLYLAQRQNASLADVFARAQIQVQENGDQRRYNEFMGKEPRSVKNLGKASEKLRDEILQHCQKSDLGEHVDVCAFDDDGTLIFRVLRGDRTRKPLVVRGRTARATIEYRPVHGDLLRYESSIGRLRIAARSASIVEFYRGMLGKVLFGDEFFFDGAPACSLRVLQERGRLALQDHGVFGVGRVWITECVWERGDRNFVHIRSSDCLRSIEELRLPVAEGEIIQAKLKVEVIGKSTRPVTINIRVPSRIEVSQRIHEDQMDRVLHAVGIRNPLSSDSAALSLWSLHPWRQPVASWRTVFGSEMDALVRAGVLKAVQLDSVQHPEHPEAGRSLSAQAMSGGQYYGVSQVPEIASRSLSASDLDGLELLPEAFRFRLRSALGIASGGATWDGQDLLHLGFMEVGGQRLYLAYAVREPASGVGERIRNAAGGAHPVILMPAPARDALELASVLLEKPVARRAQVIREAIRVCGLADITPAIHFAPDGAQLVVDTRLKKVWVHGVEIDDLPPDSQRFRFIELMARSSAPVSLDEISSKLSSGRQDETTTARQAKNSAKKSITQAMANAERQFEEDPFPTAGTGFYRCVLPAYVR